MEGITTKNNYSFNLDSRSDTPDYAQICFEGTDYFIPIEILDIRVWCAPGRMGVIVKYWNGKCYSNQGRIPFGIWGRALKRQSRNLGETR